MSAAEPYKRRRGRKATRAATLLEGTIRRAGEARGFAVSRLLTHWDEIAGPDMAAMARPVRVSHGKGGIGATLILLTSGAQAPLVQMELERLRARVNGCYGYNAVSRIRLTQTASEAPYAPRPAAPAQRPPDPAAEARAADAASGVADPSLRAALEQLGRAVLTPRSSQ